MSARGFTLGELAGFCGARIAAPSERTVRGVALDSRRVAPGNLFVAVPGRPEPFFHEALNDGLPYCSAAVEAGASAVLAEREVEVPPGAGVLVSENVYGALRSVGLAARRSFGGQVVGIVGSCGKTTVKAFARDVLSMALRVHASEGNRNNLLGVPETLANADAEAGAWVVEMGISAPGEMDVLAAGVEPTSVIFTTVQPVHLQFFLDLAAIRDEKARVLEHLRPGGFAVLNADDPLLAGLRVPEGTRKITYGESVEADLRFVVEAPGDAAGTSFRLAFGGATARGFLATPGRHQVANFAAACAAGVAAGVNLEAAASAASSVRASTHRGQVVRLAGGTLLLDDAYNANPTAVEAVLGTVAGWGRRTVAALGEMRELGASSQEHHRRAGRLASSLGISALLCVGGAGASAMGESFAESGRPTAVVGRWEDGADWLLGRVRPGDAVLVKGSRAWGLEGLVEHLSKELAP